MRFIDQTEIWVSSGNGGDGSLSFKRARNKPKLGPDGGNGGDGGSVYFCADLGMNTLASLRYRKEFRAEHAAHGGSNTRTGRNGTHLKIKVPLGTLFYDAESGDYLGELTDPDKDFLIAKGGKGGLGNMEFVSSTNRAPRTRTLGEKGIHLHLRLELKVLADVGLAGFPNAGKSTLLSVLSDAKPKIADYPFTTLHPILGVVEDKKSSRSFVVADIPGLLEGASQGKGLGFEFLRHLERNKIIAYILDGSLKESLLDQYESLKHELYSFNETFQKKRQLVVINKLDLLSEEDKALVEKSFAKQGIDILFISAAAKIGLDTLIQTFADHLDLLLKESPDEDKERNGS